MEIKNRTKEINEYKRLHYKSIRVEFRKEDFEDLQAAAEAAGEKVNTYIKKSIRERMEKEERSNADC